MDFLNYIVLGLYVVMLVIVAVLTRKRSKTLKDFLFADKGLGGWMTAFAYGTTYFSSVIIIGYAGNLGWNFGLSVIWIGIGNALIGSLLAWKVLANRTRRATQYLDVKTMPEYFESRYQSKHIKLLSAIVIFVFLIPYSASVYQGLSYLFTQVFQIDFNWCVIIFAGLTALYLFFGGYFATALSDFIQGIIMIVGIICFVGFVLSAKEVNFLEGLGEITNQGLGLFPSFEGGFDSNFFNILIFVLLTSFGVWGLPQTIHKFYSIKGQSAIKKATIISTVFCLIIGVSAYLIGALGRLFFTAHNVEQIVPDIMMQVLPAGILGLVVVLVLSASMSTLSSLSLSGASAISIDVYKGYINKNASDKKVNLLTRFLCLGFVVLSMLFALVKIDVIVTMMGLSWGTLAGCFIGPYVYGLYSKKASKAACYTSIITTLAVTFILILVFGFTSSPAGTNFDYVLVMGIKKAPLIGVICMALSMVVTPIVSHFTKSPDGEFVDKLFANMVLKDRILTPVCEKVAEEKEVETSSDSLNCDSAQHEEK